MLEFSEWNTGKVYMSADRVDEIMSVCGISRASYHRAVRELIDKGIITKGKGSYTIAENMFWKGEVKMRDRVIKSKMRITFTPVFPENEWLLSISLLPEKKNKGRASPYPREALSNPRRLL